MLSQLKDLLRDLLDWGSGVMAKKHSFLREYEEQRKRLIVRGIQSTREEIELSREIARVESKIAPLQARAAAMRARRNWNREGMVLRFQFR
ncbi:hypothetical protein AMTR_s00107p00152140 [Amborella trichopoda]|uniref:Uncharacterized protein n=1 Tax=Amborella trichopoda TaxID=13333 RepID=W1NT07_AMBTC|nr:hypothetical protein AMTR_s00107p00152140 [Amborella trichopoda]